MKCPNIYCPPPTFVPDVSQSAADPEFTVLPLPKRTKIYSNFTILPLCKVQDDIFIQRLWYTPKPKHRHVDLVKFLVNYHSAKAVAGVSRSFLRKSDNHYLKQVMLPFPLYLNLQDFHLCVHSIKFV